MGYLVYEACELHRAIMFNTRVVLSIQCLIQLKGYAIMLRGVILTMKHVSLSTQFVIMQKGV